MVLVGKAEGFGTGCLRADVAQPGSNQGFNLTIIGWASILDGFSAKICAL